jgi:V8-like Glu-specific endopeptidase
MNMGRGGYAGLVVAAGAMLAVVGGVVALRGSATAAVAAESYKVTASDADGTAAYWTLKRIAGATPDVGTGSGSGLGQRSRTLGTANTFAGSPLLGVLLYNDGKTDHFCTASVVNSSKRNLLLTAAHCLYSAGRGFRKNVAFIPKFYQGKEPYGLWTAKRLFVDRRWKRSADMDLDFGFVALNPLHNAQIQNVVGGNPLGINHGYRNWVHVMGYPSSGDKPIICAAWTHKKFTYQIQFDCHGYYGGTSGSPWVVNYDAKHGTGQVIGVIGGYQEGGNAEYTSYSATFDSDVWNLRISADRQA